MILYKCTLSDFVVNYLFRTVIIIREIIGNNNKKLVYARHNILGLIERHLWWLDKYADMLRTPWVVLTPVGK